MPELDASLLEVGPANVYLSERAKAFLETNLAGVHNDLRYEALLGGTDGNLVTVEYIDPAAINQALKVVTVGKRIRVFLATDGLGAITSTADSIKNAVNSHIVARGLVSVVRKAGNDGSGVVTVFAETFLAGGSNTENLVNVGFMGEELAVAITAEAVALTGAQTGNVPQDKVISGGSFVVTVPFKEISLDAIRRAFPNAFVFKTTDGKQRIDFTVRVGASMRKRASRMEIRKFVGGAESADPKDTLVIPLAAPTDAEVSLPFSPTDQRVITASFEAWPDSNGRWAFTGDEEL